MKMSVLNVFNDFLKFACRSRSTRAPLSPSAAEISTLRAASAPLSLPPATTGGGRLHAASPCVPPMVRHGHARQARGVSLFDPPQPMGKGSAVRSHHVCRRRHVAVAQANFTPPSLRYRLPAAAGEGSAAPFAPPFLREKSECTQLARLLRASDPPSAAHMVRQRGDALQAVVMEGEPRACFARRYQYKRIWSRWPGR